MRVAVFYESMHGHTSLVAERIAEGLRKAGHEATVKKCGKASHGDLSSAEAILVGSSVQMGKHRPKAVSFVKTNLEALKSKPSAFFSVSMTGRLKTEGEKQEMERILAAFRRDSGWEPVHLACFAGALMYRKYWFPLRWLMRSIAKSQANDIDTSRNHIYTDWEAVDRFAAEFAAGVPGKSLA